MSVFQSMSSHGYTSIHPTLSFANVIPLDSRVFDVIKAGDVEMLQSMMIHRQASIRDCDPEGRSLLTVRRSPVLPSLGVETITILQYAYYDEQPAICKFLVKFGADLNAFEKPLGWGYDTTTIM